MKLGPRRFLLVLALLVAACGGAGSASDDDGDGEANAGGGLLIRWHVVEDAAGYVIHWGAQSGVYIHTLDAGAPAADANGVVSFHLADVDAMGTIYFALTSYDDEYQMSAFSNEIAALVP